MTIVTDKGNFGSFKDILKDMAYEGYDTITVTDTLCIANQIHLGRIGYLTMAEVEKISEEMEEERK